MSDKEFNYVSIGSEFLRGAYMAAQWAHENYDHQDVLGDEIFDATVMEEVRREMTPNED